MFDDTIRPTCVVSNKLHNFNSDLVVKLLEAGNSVSLASAIIQLFLSSEPTNDEWFKHSTGILCLVKDYTRKSYYFQLYNLVPQVVWEEELYSNFMLYKLKERFYFFPGFNCNVGFNFAFVEEADLLNLTIRFVGKQISYLIDTATVNSSGNSRPTAHTAHLSTFKPNSNRNSVSVTANQLDLHSNDESSEESISTVSGSNSRSSRAKKIVEKNNISGPIEFVHVNHISLSNCEAKKFNVRVAEKDKGVENIIKVLKNLNMKQFKSDSSTTSTTTTNSDEGELYSTVDLRKRDRTKNATTVRFHADSTDEQSNYFICSSLMTPTGHSSPKSPKQNVVCAKSQGKRHSLKDQRLMGMSTVEKASFKRQSVFQFDPVPRDNHLEEFYLNLDNTYLDLDEIDDGRNSFKRTINSNSNQIEIIEKKMHF